MPKAKLIVASARLPVTVTRRQEGWEATRSTGGLVTALSAVSAKREFEWIGWPGTAIGEGERAAVTRELARHGALPVFVSKADSDGFYLGFSNRVLWPLFHNLTDRVHFDASAFRAYQRVNEAFADVIVKSARPGDVVWVHDYQLALLPELLRRRGLRARIGFFLHIPFPSAETYRQLPPREEILRGLLGADFIGFHAYEYVSHFRAACLRVLGLDGDVSSVHLSSRDVRLGALPIGIEPQEIRDLARGRDAREELASLQASYAGKKIVVGVDRLDYTKGIPDKLRAFDLLLRTHHKWRDRVILIQVAAPSRMGVDEYQKLKREVDELVGGINGRYGTPSSVPVIYVNQNVPRSRLVGLFQAAEVALITPLRDGMNLVALEYAASRAERGGTLILSEFAGAAHSLPGARLVNPHDTSGVCETLNEALEHEPRADDFSHMQRFIEENTSAAWAKRFLSELEGAESEARPPAELLSMDHPRIASLAARAERPLVLLDYDGTLRSYVLDPRDAVPGADILAVLSHLAEQAEVYVISGRSQQVLEHWLGHLPIGLVCEHGLSIRPPGGRWERRVRVSGTALRRLVDPLFRDFVQRTPGARVEHKDAAVAWHYRGVDPELAAHKVTELLTLLEERLRRRPYSVLHGNRVIEVRHRRVTKGQALAAVLKRHGNADFLFCAGDDRTDEEMMQAIPARWRAKTISCWVGARNAAATYWVESNGQLLAFLDRLAERLAVPRKPAPRARSSAELEARH